MDYRSTASFGKREEYVAVTELLRRGFDIYMTLIDDQQIDYIIRQEQKSKLRYLDVQIKARSNNVKHAGTFAVLTVRNPRSNYLFIFFSEVINTYWIIPSIDLVKLDNINKGGKSKKGKNKDKFIIILANKNKTGWKPRPKFSQYENNFSSMC
jgi:hypothetical protein